MSEAERLADEYRTTMPREVLDLWASETAAELRRLSAVERELEALKASLVASECQYSKDVGMAEYGCVGKCKYEALALAVMSDQTGKA